MRNQLIIAENKRLGFATPQRLCAYRPLLAQPEIGIQNKSKQHKEPIEVVIDLAAIGCY